MGWCIYLVSTNIAIDISFGTVPSAKDSLMRHIVNVCRRATISIVAKHFQCYISQIYVWEKGRK